jgi:exopolyphosphatase / guanosine-5'-triphosphate,3'-diphosphate pyrophosphatase
VPRYAAIDIGSNSVRIEAAEILPGRPARVLGSDREVTRLGESVFRTGSVSEEALKSTCAVLARMAALYRKLDVAGVRAVATSAVRDASNQKEFLARASEAVGAQVEIISGREEARLIHLGVESVWPQKGKRVLILDIGGGSAEIIAAEDGHLIEAFSRPLGAVRMREMFLGEDPPPPYALRQMNEYIEEKLGAAVRRLGTSGWGRAIATSATASAAASAVARTPRSKRDEIDRQRITTTQARQLYGKLATLGVAARRKVTGIGPRRAEIIVPGLAVLLEFLVDFKLPAVYYSRAGVRDGIIADLAGRNVGAELSRLTREQRAEVEEMCRRYGVSLAHARKVAGLASMLFTALQPVHQMPAAMGRLLEAAAYLHDVGHYISNVAHHKHSWYVVAHSDMPGFTERERMTIAALCRYHRKALPNPQHNAFGALSADERRGVQLGIPILRLADNLDRSHEQRVQSIEGKVRDNGAIVLSVAAKGDIDLEQWAAQRAGETFREIYGREITIARAK